MIYVEPAPDGALLTVCTQRYNVSLRGEPAVAPPSSTPRPKYILSSPRSLPSKRAISAHQAHSALISCSASARPLPSLPFPSLDPSSFSSLPHLICHLYSIPYEKKWIGKDIFHFSSSPAFGSLDLFEKIFHPWERFG